MHAKAVAEPYAFALLRWPAVIGLLLLQGSSGMAATVALAVFGGWLALTILAAYGGGRDIGFGNAMLAANVCVAAAGWAWPSAWSLAWLVPLLLLLLAAQQLRLRGLPAA